MKLAEAQERLVNMLKESITLMCKSSLSFDMELNIEGLLGITMDKKDIFLVNINESFKSPTWKPPGKEKEVDSPLARGQKRDVIEIKGEGEELPPCSKKKRTRKRSRESPGS